MKDEQMEALRKPFDAGQVGKLPRTTCRACSDNKSRVCSEHSKKKCPECKNYMTTAHMHIDYVGHPEVTDRLLKVDPQWNWEPVAFTTEGAPLLERDGQGRAIGMWIRLTVCGVTRLGYGSVEAGKFEAEKQLIGDALRNAAMRFGVALDLWSKAERASEDEPVSSGGRQNAAQSGIQRQGESTSAPAPASPTGKAVNMTWGDEPGQSDVSPGKTVNMNKALIGLQPAQRAEVMQFLAANNAEPHKVPVDLESEVADLIGRLTGVAA